MLKILAVYVVKIFTFFLQTRPKKAKLLVLAKILLTLKNPPFDVNLRYNPPYFLFYFIFLKIIPTKKKQIFFFANSSEKKESLKIDFVRQMTGYPCMKSSWYARLIDASPLSHEKSKTIVFVDPLSLLPHSGSLIFKVLRLFFHREVHFVEGQTGQDSVVVNSLGQGFRS